MRIALLFEFGTLNGGEHSMLAAVDRLRDRFEFVAVAPPTGRLAETLCERGLEHVAFDIRDSTGRRQPPEEILEGLQAIAEQRRPDLLHANSLSMSRWTGRLRRGGFAVPCTGHLRDIVNTSAAVLSDLGANDRLVAVSRATRDHHCERGLDRSRVEVLYNGVDLDRFRPRPRTGRLRAELGLDEDAVIALAVGQIGLRKGLDVLAEAVTATRAQRLHLVLVGERLSAKEESVEFDEAITGRFAKAGLSDHLHRLGYRDDVPSLMNEADLLVHAANQEPLGRVLLEAAASGLPIVATNVGGTPEILDRDSAVLVEPGTPDALADGLTTVLTDPASAQERAVAARGIVEARFDAHSAAVALGEFWSAVVS